MLAGIELWLDSDPGAWYLQSGHQIGRVPAVFFGHPGIPLKLGNHFVQKIIYHIYHGAGESYTDCIVRELYSFKYGLVVSWLLYGFLWHG